MSCRLDYNCDCGDWSYVYTGHIYTGCTDPSYESQSWTRAVQDGHTSYLSLKRPSESVVVPETKRHRVAMTTGAVVKREREGDAEIQLPVKRSRVDITDVDMTDM